MSGSHYKNFFPLVACFAVLSASATYATEPVLMAGLGDSISAATFANKSASSRQFELSNMAGQPGIPFLGKVQNKATYSWVSGSKIPSHAVRLAQFLGHDSSVTILNAAVPGSKAGDVLAQAQAVVEAMKSGNYSKLLYVTLMIGANDVCSVETPTGTPDGRMHDQLMAIYDTLAQIEQKEPIHILVSGLPKIPDLARPEILYMHTVNLVTCEKLRDNLLKACPSMTSWRTPAQYTEALAQLAVKNQLLQDVAAEAAAKYPQLAIQFTNTFYETQIPSSELARDCFHPNRYGQTDLANRLWAAQPWFH